MVWGLKIVLCCRIRFRHVRRRLLSRCCGALRGSVEWYLASEQNGRRMRSGMQSFETPRHVRLRDSGCLQARGGVRVISKTMTWIAAKVGLGMLVGDEPPER